MPTVKIIGPSGRIFLGKKFAGRQVLVEEIEPGVWMVRTATVVPANERWLMPHDVREHLQEALAWAQSHPASGAGTEAVMQRLVE